MLPSLPWQAVLISKPFGKDIPTYRHTRSIIPATKQAKLTENPKNKHRQFRNFQLLSSEIVKNHKLNKILVLDIIITSNFNVMCVCIKFQASRES